MATTFTRRVMPVAPVSKFTTSGQIVNANLITGIPDGANGLALSGNMLYVADISQVEEYDATTGALCARSPQGFRKQSVWP